LFIQTPSPKSSITGKTESLRRGGLNLFKGDIFEFLESLDKIIDVRKVLVLIATITENTVFSSSPIIEIVIGYKKNGYLLFIENIQLRAVVKKLPAVT